MLTSFIISSRRLNILKKINNISWNMNLAMNSIKYLIRITLSNNPMKILLNSHDNSLLNRQAFRYWNRIIPNLDFFLHNNSTMYVFPNLAIYLLDTTMLINAISGRRILVYLILSFLLRFCINTCINILIKHTRQRVIVSHFIQIIDRQINNINRFNITLVKNNLISKCSNSPGNDEDFFIDNGTIYYKNHDIISTKFNLRNLHRAINRVWENPWKIVSDRCSIHTLSK